MAARATSKSFRSLTGVIFLFVAAIAFSLLAAQTQEFISRSTSDSWGVLASVGMASLRAMQALAFDDPLVSWFAVEILILFAALGMAAAGLALLRNDVAKWLRGYKGGIPLSVRGDQ